MSTLISLILINSFAEPRKDKVLARPGYKNESSEELPDSDDSDSGEQSSDKDDEEYLNQPYAEFEFRFLNESELVRCYRLAATD